MASGLLAQTILTATTSTTAYTVPAGKTASITVAFCNQNSSDSTKVRLSLTSLSTATANSYLEYDANIPPNGILERGALVLAAAQNVIVRATSSDVSVIVYGIEE
jgi:hypothetical protein